MYLGWDIGIKNLSYCLLDKNHNIIDWNIINLTRDHKNKNIPCCATVKSTNKVCGKKSIMISKDDSSIGYCKTHSKNQNNLIEFNENITCHHENCNKDATYYKDNIYFCTKHLPKDKKTQFMKIKKNAAKTPLIDLGKELYKKLDNYPHFLDVEIVIIENQPVLKNPTMKSIQMMLYSYFLMNGVMTNHKLYNIILMSANSKLKVYDGPKITQFDNIKSKYTRNKKLAIEHCNYYLKDKYYDFFNQHKKKDDLADAYLMTKYYLVKNIKTKS